MGKRRTGSDVSEICARCGRAAFDEWRKFPEPLIYRVNMGINVTELAGTKYLKRTDVLLYFILVNKI